MASYAQEDTLTVHRLRTLRLERAMTQEELAAAAGLSPGTINRLEATPGKPVRPGTVRRLAEALKVPVLQLTRCGPRPTGEEAAA